jgi:O-antigen ligase
MTVVSNVQRSSRLPRIVDALRSAWRPVAVVAFVGLIPLLLLTRAPLPGGGSFGYQSFARNVVIFVLAGVLIRAPELRLPRSTLGAPLLVYLAAAALSVVVNHADWGGVRLFGAAIGTFFVARILAAGESGPGWLFHWLGAFVVGIVAYELVHNPYLLTLREAYRHDFMVAHANTLGYSFALLWPVFLAGTARPGRRVAAVVYAACALVGVAVTLSRAGWIGVVVGAAALAFVARPRRLGTLATLATVAGLATAAAVAVVGYLSLGRSEADIQRLQIIKASLSLFRQHWLFGIGFGIRNLEGLFPARYLELYGKKLFLFHSHNFYVDVLTGTGVVGGVAATWLLYRLVRLVAEGVRRATSPAQRLDAASYLISTLVLLLIGLVDTPVYHAKLIFLLAVAWAMFEGASQIGLAQADRTHSRR